MADRDQIDVPPALHELEVEVMEIIWQRGDSSVRETLEELNRKDVKQRAYTTVMTTMTRLDAKGLLSRRRVGRGDIYSPVMSREEYLQARARAEVGALVSEFGDVALVHFARQMDQLDPKRREALRRLARRG